MQCHTTIDVCNDSSKILVVETKIDEDIHNPIAGKELLDLDLASMGERTRTALYDGRDSQKYLAKLAELEAKAKLFKRGAWRFAK